MNDNQFHDLAVAYAQAKLMLLQQENPELCGYDEELQTFLRSYLFALHRLPVVEGSIDEV